MAVNENTIPICFSRWPNDTFSCAFAMQRSLVGRGRRPDPRPGTAPGAGRSPTVPAGRAGPWGTGRVVGRPAGELGRVRTLRPYGTADGRN
ncbi:hypothetical protein GCM10027615_74610 [Plantactinospora veratri]